MGTMTSILISLFRSDRWVECPLNHEHTHTHPIRAVSAAAHGEAQPPCLTWCCTPLGPPSSVRSEPRGSAHRTVLTGRRFVRDGS